MRRNPKINRSLNVYLCISISVIAFRLAFAEQNAVSSRQLDGSNNGNVAPGIFSVITSASLAGINGTLSGVFRTALLTQRAASNSSQAQGRSKTLFAHQHRS
jgi:hypothetical protein